MAKRGYNPVTRKSYEWEERQAALKAQDPAHIAKHVAMLKRQQAAMLARDSLIKYTLFTSPHPSDPDNIEMSTYEPAPFHERVAEALEELERGDSFTQLIFCMPPRHGKTRLATQSLAEWYSGRHPDHDIAVAMATDLLATDVGANVRNTMASAQYKQVFPQHRLTKGGAAKDNIQTDRRGRLVFVGRGGTLNGRGAHLLLVDDLYKDDKEASSQTIRDDAWNWFVRVALRRRMGKKLTVLTMTRWHSDDIIGRLTDPENPHYNADEAKQWKIILLRGIAEEDDVLGREPGEALWPERYSAEYLMADQRRDPLGFAALTQQRPSLLEGDMFKREDVRFYKANELPEDLRFYAASDHAVSTKQRRDPSCFLKVGVSKQNDIYITECIWRKMPSDVAVEAMLAMAKGNNKPIIWWAERGHISKSIGPFLRKRMLETSTYINIREVTPVADKAQRAQSIAARVAMGKVYFPADAIWTERAINELLAFPNATHDDFVDALAYIGLGLQSQFGKNVTKADVRAKQQPKFGTLAWVKLADKWAAEQRANSAGGF